MVIPDIKKSIRKREYSNYSPEEHRKVVKAYLFDGMSHRMIDSEILGLDSLVSKGFQSMSILHFIGLTAPFKGLFKEMDVHSAIYELSVLQDSSFYELIEILKRCEIGTEICENDIIMECSHEYEVLREGQKKEYYTTRYERNPLLRKQAVQIHGTTCMACDFNFAKSYGERGKDYIEVHHIKPLSQSGEEVEVNPSTDMVVVCANCHRMIHRKKGEILSLEELKKILL